MGVLDRMIKASTEWGMRMQPRRAERVSDEYLYAAPSFRDQVSAIRDAESTWSRKECRRR